MTTFYDRLLELISTNRELSISQSGAFSSYVDGLRKLKNRLGPKHARYQEALIYENRLNENISRSLRYGETDTLKAERSQIIDRLNELALSEEDVSFNELCGLSMSAMGARSQDITALAKDVLQFPLCLVPIPEPDRSLLLRLESARSKLEHGAVDDAVKELDRAMQLMRLAGEFEYIHVVRLFQSGLYEKRGDYENAQLWAKQAYEHFPEGDHLHRVVVVLIQGNNYLNNSRSGRRITEAIDAYSEAIWRLEQLEKAEKELGNRDKAELYRVLKENAQQYVDEPPFPLPPSEPTERNVHIPPAIPCKVLPIVDEISAGKPKPASGDVIGYIQTDKFEFEGQKLKVEFLKGSQLTFLPEYDYFAMRVVGDSMDQAGISPNDYVILQKPKLVGLQPVSGDIVAVVFRKEGNSATLKRFYFHEPSARVILKPESSNSVHIPRPLPPEVFLGDNSPVVGIAIAVLKPQPPEKDL